MADPTAIGVNLILYVAVIVVFLKEWDYAAYSLLFAIMVCIFSSFYFGTPAEEYVTHRFSCLVIYCILPDHDNGGGKKYGVTDFNYRSLTKVGGSFALMHIAIIILMLVFFL